MNAAIVESRSSWHSRRYESRSDGLQGPAGTKDVLPRPDSERGEEGEELWRLPDAPLELDEMEEIDSLFWACVDSELGF